MKTEKNNRTGTTGEEVPPSGPLTSDFLKSVVRSPGVYLMKSRQGKILYVGKAKDLRKRLSSYQRKESHPPKTSLLLKKVAEVETIITQTEKEAFILEASLIKKYRPRFNIELKDDKSYPRIKVTLGEEWPRVYMTRRRIRDGSMYFGPYSSVGAMKNTLNLINRMFPLRRCRGRILKKRMRPCLNHQMGRCLAPCCLKVHRKQYDAIVENVLMVLEGRNRQLYDQLKVQMQKASDALDYEKAAMLRDQLQALDKTLEQQVVVSNRDRDQDIFGYVRKGTGIGIVIINVRQGTVLSKMTYFLVDPIGNDPEVLGEVVRQFYGEEHSVPDEILLPFRVGDHQVLAEWLAETRGKNVKVMVPKRGQGAKLMQMAAANADQVHTAQENKEKSWQEMAANLQTRLKLSCVPTRVECLDISNISGKQAVGAFVCFIEGEKASGQYRHYSITGPDEPDDYRMMDEVLHRRFKTAGHEGDVPDLLVIDGGKGHLNIAYDVLKKKNLLARVEVVAIAKDRQGKKDKIYRPGRKNPVNLPSHSPLLFFLMRLRDEAHRFGISFHRRLRHRKTFASELDRIEGIGPKRKRSLLKAMGSLAAVRKASREDLAAVEGVGPELAGQIWNFFH